MTSDELTFWGTRGSIPRTGPDFAHYGGATSCVQIGPLLLDAGTGIVAAGDALLAQGQREFHVLLSHVHFDHVMGIPFFQPLWRNDCQVHFYVGNLTDMSGREMLFDLMRVPFFPVDPSYFKAQWQIHDFNAGEDLNVAGRAVRTLPLTHPQGATGYRVSGLDICYITDIEPDQAMGERLVDFIQGSQAMIYDCTFGDDDFEVDHGHSTWRDCLKFCQSAGVPNPIIFHHHPRSTDQQIAAVESQALAVNPRTIVARDGLCLQADDFSGCPTDCIDRALLG